MASNASWVPEPGRVQDILFAVWLGQNATGRFAILVIAAAMGATVALMGLILVLHRRSARRADRADRLKGRWLSTLLDPTTSDPLVVRRGDLETFLAVWTQLVESIRGDYRDALVAKVREAGIPPLLRVMAREGNVRQKLSSVRVLGSLRDTESYSLLAEHGVGVDPFLSLQAATSMLQIDPHKALEFLLPRFVVREDWPLARVHAALAEMDVDLVSGRLEAQILGDLPVVRLRAVRLIGSIRQESRIMVLQKVFDAGLDLSWETEAALLEQIQDPSLAPIARQRLDHPVWQVVVAACKALGRSGSEADVPALADLLAHPQWWVRYRAARAISGFPQIRPIEVEMLAARQADPFARDMLRFALAEQNLT